MKPEIIINAKGHAGTMATLQSEFTAHLLVEAPDRNAFLKQHASAVGGLAIFGPMAVAGTALALIMNTVRTSPQSEQCLRAGNWASRGPYPLTTPRGGKTLGILGLGRIGEAVAKRAAACGMKIRYHNRNKKNVPYPYDPDPVTLAKNCDVLMVVAPATAETNRIVSAKVLDALGPRKYLVNIARGSLVDEPVLLRYLQEKKIAGAGLDVFADEPRVPPEFFTLDNAVLCPHVGSATVETRKAMGDLQIENLRRHFAGKPVLTRVV